MTPLRRYRAFRFVHPDLAQEERVDSPGLQVSPSGRIEMVEGDQSVRQSILMLLSTSPGERVMRPDYGCHLRRLVFAPNDETTAGLAIHYVRRAIERWEPRIEIVGLDAVRGDQLDVRTPEADDGDEEPSEGAGGGGDGGDGRARLRGAPDDSLVIILDYRVRASRQAGTFVYSLDLAGEAR